MPTPRTIGVIYGDCQACGGPIVARVCRSCGRYQRHRYEKKRKDCDHPEEAWREGPVSYTGGMGMRTDVCGRCGETRTVEA